MLGTGTARGIARRTARSSRGLATLVAAGTLAGFATLPAGATTHRPASDALATVARSPRIPAGAQRIGSVSGSTTLRVGVALRPRNAAALTAFATAVSTPGSRSYHQYISPAGFAARFGPSAATIAAVRSSLAAEGLSVGKVSKNGLLLPVRGTAARIDAAFHTTTARFRLADGAVGISRTSAIRLPGTIARSISAVVGLDNLVHPHSVAALHATTAQARTHRAAVAKAAPHITGAPNACSAASAMAVASGGLTDSQIAQAYGVDGLYSAGDFAAGKTVAIYELEPYATSDIKSFDQCYFGNSAATTMLSHLHRINVDGGQQVGPGSGESELDIEDVAALAPQATINVYQAPNTEYGGLDEYNRIVSDDTAQVISTSWGLCEAAVQAGEPGVQGVENVIFEEAAAQGQSAFSAAGDDGSDDCAGHASTPVAPTLSVDDPSSQPYVVAVGGTTIDTIGSNGPSERVWNDGAYWGAGGGGISDSWIAPTWQAQSGVPGFANSTVVAKADTYAAANGIGGGGFCQTDAADGSGTTPCRELPDVTAQADEFTGAITVYQAQYGGWTTFGGTSSATPIWAALTADMAASSGCTGTAGLGFVSPELYAVASNPTTYAASFNDIKAGNNDTFGSTKGLFGATTGFDMAAGLGSPRVTGTGGSNGLAHYLCADAAAASSGVTVTNLAPQAVTSAGGSVTVTGTGFENGSTPDVAGVQIGGYAAPASAINVNSATSLTVTVPAAADLRAAGQPEHRARQLQRHGPDHRRPDVARRSVEQALRRRRDRRIQLQAVDQRRRPLRRQRGRGQHGDDLWLVPERRDVGDLRGHRRHGRHPGLGPRADRHRARLRLERHPDGVRERHRHGDRHLPGGGRRDERERLEHHERHPGALLGRVRVQRRRRVHGT